MFKASSSWIGECEKRLHEQGAELTRRLPPALRKDAKWVLASTKAWEWKHLWFENAKLWHQQASLTKKLKAQWDQDHDVVFEAWNKSEHAGSFLKALNQGQSVKASSLLALEQLQTQLQQMTIRHFAKPGTALKSYRLQFEFGEFPVKALNDSIQVDRGEVEFYSWDKKNFSAQMSKITQALGLIKTYSPDSYDLFCAFTRRIVPIKQKEFVSYSLQSLPGHSFINLYHRDRLDLLDDLLHENGHHHLNHFLILKEPLREDPDQIYYSPWRRTLRPVRGIYHAHLTFFFALKLYHDLAQALLSDSLFFDSPLTSSEKQKIYLRYLEEWFMLEYTADDLTIAIKRGQVLKNGAHFLKAAEVERKKLGNLVKAANDKLGSAQKRKIAELKKTLGEQARLTRG
jgi:hypothetical protein